MSHAFGVEEVLARALGVPCVSHETFSMGKVLLLHDTFFRLTQLHGAHAPCIQKLLALSHIQMDAIRSWMKPRARGHAMGDQLLIICFLTSKSRISHVSGAEVDPAHLQVAICVSPWTI